MAIFPFVRLYPARVLANSVCLVQEGAFFPTKSRGVANFRFCGVRSTKNMRSSKRWHNRKAVTKNCLWSQWMKRDKHCHSTGVFRIRVIRVIRTCFHDLFGLSKYFPEAASIGEWGKLLLKLSFSCCWSQVIHVRSASFELVFCAASSQRTYHWSISTMEDGVCTSWKA